MVPYTGGVFFTKNVQVTVRVSSFPRVAALLHRLNISQVQLTVPAGNTGRMNDAQLIYFFAIFILWVLLAEGLYPWLEGNRLRHNLRLLGWGLFLLMFFGSLLSAPSFQLWLEYAAITFVVYIIMRGFNTWALSPAGDMPDIEVG